jgi:hypothetical protein
MEKTTTPARILVTKSRELMRKAFQSKQENNFKNKDPRPVLQKRLLGVALSSSAAWPKLGCSAIETFFRYNLRKRARSGRARSGRVLQVPEELLKKF